MRAISLLLLPLAVSAAGSLLPSSAQAAKIPYCIQKVTGELCFYAVDRTDCIEVDGQEYCRTVGWFRWDI
jgi:hypothetical protein